jgi:hypothetical protein
LWKAYLELQYEGKFKNDFLVTKEHINVSHLVTLIRAATTYGNIDEEEEQEEREEEKNDNELYNEIENPEVEVGPPVSIRRVTDYLHGLWWNIHMYINGRCPDDSFVWPLGLGPT